MAKRNRARYPLPVVLFTPPEAGDVPPNRGAPYAQWPGTRHVRHGRNFPPKQRTANRPDPCRRAIGALRCPCRTGIKGSAEEQARREASREATRSDGLVGPEPTWPVERARPRATRPQSSCGIRPQRAGQQPHRGGAEAADGSVDYKGSSRASPVADQSMNPTSSRSVLIPPHSPPV